MHALHPCLLECMVHIFLCKQLLSKSIWWFQTKIRSYPKAVLNIPCLKAPRVTQSPCPHITSFKYVPLSSIILTFSQDPFSQISGRSCNLVRNSKALSLKVWRPRSHGSIYGAIFSPRRRMSFHIWVFPEIGVPPNHQF